MADLICGTFIHKKTEKDVEFYSKVFFESKEMIGATLTLTLAKNGDKRWIYSVSCKECPQFNDFGIYYEDIWQEVNNAALGGKAKIRFQLNAAKDGIFNEIESATLGKWTFSGKFTDEGYHVTTTKDGLSHTEYYQRVINENGSYKYDHDENGDEFMKKSGYPESMMATMKDFKIEWCVSEDGCFFFAKWFGNHKILTSGKLDEEVDYKFPFEGIPAGKYIVTKTGANKYTSMFKCSNGMIEEWKMIFANDGLCLSGRNLQKGFTCKYWLKRYHDFTGTWRPIAHAGLKEMMSFIGLPTGQAKELCNEYDARFEIEQKGPFIKYCLKSKHAPLNDIFKFDEETEIFHPMLKENVKMIYSMNGNKIFGVMKAAKFEAKFCNTHGTTFMVSESHIIGLNLSTKTIFERVH